VYWAAVLTAFLTAFYTGRAFFLTFFGPEKLPSPDDPEAEADDAHSHAHAAAAHAGDAHASAGADPHRPADLPAPAPGETDEPVPQHGHAQGGGGHGHDAHFGHESPPVMTLPLIVLAVCAVLVGIVFGPTHLFEHHLEMTPGFHALAGEEHAADYVTPVVGTLVGVLGIGLSWVLYGKPSEVPGSLARQIKPLYLASYRKFGIDELYNGVVVWPVKFTAYLAAFFDRYVIDGLVNVVARAPRLLGREGLAPFQNGLVQFYAAATALVLAVLLLVFVLM
jgi:NADH-quinone oxidoreductase subunit L